MSLFFEVFSAFVGLYFVILLGLRFAFLLDENRGN